MLNTCSVTRPWAPKWLASSTSCLPALPCHSCLPPSSKGFLLTLYPPQQEEGTSLVPIPPPHLENEVWRCPTSWGTNGGRWRGDLQEQQHLGTRTVREMWRADTTGASSLGLSEPGPSQPSLELISIVSSRGWPGRWRCHPGTRESRITVG